MGPADLQRQAGGRVEHDPPHLAVTGQALRHRDRQLAGPARHGRSGAGGTPAQSNPSRTDKPAAGPSAGVVAS